MDITLPFNQLLFTTTRIIVENRDGSFESGTGFVFSRKITETTEVPLLVTNRHVVENKKSATFLFSLGRKGTPDLGKAAGFRVTRMEEKWQ